MAFRFIPAPTMPLSVFSAAFLLACGGGGDAPPVADTLSNESATSYAANASVVGSDAAAALDATLLTNMDLVAASAATSSSATGREQAQSTSTGTLGCAGGGTASLAITNSVAPLAELNGRLDPGEDYAVSYSNCRRASGEALLNGTLTMHVDDTRSDGATVTFSTTTLVVTLPRGSVSFNGSVTVARTLTPTGNGSSVSTHVTTSSLAVTTHFNNRTGNFTLSGLDLTRQANFIGNALQSTTYNGTHTLSAVLPNLSYSYTVATQGGAGFDANGIPNQGGWVITLPRRIVTITISASTATIAIDDGKDGSVDRSFTVPVVLLGSGAG